MQPNPPISNKCQLHGIPKARELDVDRDGLSFSVDLAAKEEVLIRESTQPLLAGLSKIQKTSWRFQKVFLDCGRIGTSRNYSQELYDDDVGTCTDSAASAQRGASMVQVIHVFGKAACCMIANEFGQPGFHLISGLFLSGAVVAVYKVDLCTVCTSTRVHMHMVSYFDLS